MPEHIIHTVYIAITVNNSLSNSLSNSLIAQLKEIVTDYVML